MDGREDAPVAVTATITRVSWSFKLEREDQMNSYNKRKKVCTGTLPRGYTLRHPQHNSSLGLSLLRCGLLVADKAMNGGVRE